MARNKTAAPAGKACWDRINLRDSPFTVSSAFSTRCTYAGVIFAGTAYGSRVAADGTVACG